jgi:hypothetical protein
MNDDKRAKKLIDAIKRNDIPAVSSLISSGSVNLNGDRGLFIVLLFAAVSKS